MLITSAKCDICGKELKADNIWSDYDNGILCKECYYKKLYRSTLDGYMHKKEWIEETHIAELNRLEKYMGTLEEKLIYRKCHKN